MTHVTNVDTSLYQNLLLYLKSAVFKAFLIVMALTPTSSHHSAGKALSDDRPDGGYRKGVKHLVETAPNMRVLPPEYVLPLPPADVIPVDGGAIPVVDLSGLGGPTEQRMSTVQVISSACADWGFFRVRTTLL
ncbi:hypothetical protein U1Q18_024538 [Sarracenia purpurea var. burkii]